MGRMCRFGLFIRVDPICINGYRQQVFLSHDRDVFMQSSNPISVIVSGSIETNSHRIQKIARELSSTRWQADIICVDAHCGDATVNQRSVLCGNVYVRVASSVGDAVRMAYFEDVAILQGNPSVEPARLNELVDKLNVDTFICNYRKVKPPKGYKRAAMIGHRLLNDVLLKSSVSPFDNAFLLFKRTHKTIDALCAADQLIASCSSRSLTQTPLSITQLISNLKMSGNFHIVSVQDVFSLSNQPAQRLTSKAIKRGTSNTVGTWWNTIMFPQATPMARKRSSPLNRRLKIGAWVLLCLITALMLNHNLKFPLFEPDEARNAQLALNILDSGNWMSLELKKEHYWDKPPLVAWMTAVSFKTFGVTENAARFPGVVVSFLTVILTCAIGQRLIGFRAAWIAALLTLFSLGIPFSGRYLTMDSALTLLASVTCLACYRGSFCRRFRQSWWVLAGVCTGLGLMTKGPVILAICVPPVLVFSWLTGRRIFQKSKQFLFFAVPAVAIGLPWFVATAIGTPEFLGHFFWQHHVVRFTEGISHQQPFWYYLPVILLLMFPASQLFIPLAKFIATRKSAVRVQRTEAHGYLLLSALWILVFFTCSSAKLPTYILPAVPMLCLLMASVIDINVFAKLASLETGSDSGASEVAAIDGFYGRLPKWLALNMVAWVIVVSLAILWLLPEHSASMLVMAASLLFVSGAAYIASRKRSHPYAAWGAVGVLALFMSALLVNHLIPAISTSRNIQLAVSKIQSERSKGGSDDSPVVYYARDSFATSMGLKESKVVYFSKEEPSAAAAFLKSHPTAILVTAPEFVEDMEKAISASVALTKQQSARHVYLAAPKFSNASSVRLAEDDEELKTR